MNYPQSKQILKEIKNAKKVLLMCHSSPDPDSIISCLLMQNFLEHENKKVDIFSKDKLHNNYKMIDVHNKIVVKDPADIDFDYYDLFFTLDASGLSRYGIDFELPKSLKIVNIDHHNSTEPAYLQIKDLERSAACEVVYYVLEDFGYKLPLEYINLVIIGILSDSEMFTYNVSSMTFITLSKFIDMGADYYKALDILYKNNSLDQLKFKSYMLSRIKIDEKSGFAYTSMAYEDYSKYQGLLMANREVADKYIRTIKDTDFGISMVEAEKGDLRISIRSRTGKFSMLPMLEELGGGGYVDGGGAGVKGLPFKKAVAKVLRVARKYAKKQHELQKNN